MNMQSLGNPEQSNRQVKQKNATLASGKIWYAQLSDTTIRFELEQSPRHPLQFRIYALRPEEKHPEEYCTDTTNGPAYLRFKYADSWFIFEGIYIRPELRKKWIANILLEQFFRLSETAQAPILWTTKIWKPLIAHRLINWWFVPEENNPPLVELIDPSNPLPVIRPVSWDIDRILRGRYPWRSHIPRTFYQVDLESPWTGIIVPILTRFVFANMDAALAQRERTMERLWDGKWRVYPARALRILNGE